MGSFALVLPSLVVDSVIYVENLPAFLAGADPAWLARYAGIVPIPDGVPVDAGWTWDGSTFSPPQSTLTLDEARELRFGQIDARTNEIFATGFEFPGSGIRLSLSLGAQSRMIGLMMVRDQATYPIRWNALDDASFVDLLGPNDVIALFGSGAAALRSYVDGGTAIKNEIRAATTVAAVMAVVDPR